MKHEEPHEILGITPKAGPREIKQAYRELVLKCHPDRTSNKESAAQTFAEVHGAYQTMIRDFEHLKIPREDHSSFPTPYPSSLSSSTSGTRSSDSTSLWDRSNSGSHTSWSSTPRDDRKVSPPSGPPSRSWRGFEMPPDGPSTVQILSEGSQTSAARSFPYSIDVPLPPYVNYERVSKSTIPLSSSNSADYNPSLLRSGPPLQSLGVGPRQDWVYSLTLTLEELFFGKHCHFGIVRHLLSGTSKVVTLDIDVPPGCQAGVEFTCRGVGHELSPGKFQDVTMVIHEAAHERFYRVNNDLVIDVQLPVQNSAKPQTIYITGVDGEEITIPIDASRIKLTRGSLVVTDAGMPIRQTGKICGRGDLVVHWEIQAQTKLPKFISRLLHPVGRQTTIVQRP